MRLFRLTRTHLTRWRSDAFLLPALVVLGAMFLVAGCTDAPPNAPAMPRSADRGIAVRALDSLAVADAHTCTISRGGHVFCWGSDVYGALGAHEGDLVPTPREVLGTLGIKSITAGSEFSCAIAIAGAYCWGDNVNGELGDGTVVDRRDPALTLPSVGRFASIAAGTEFGCGLVGSTAYCWGHNYTGELGDGTTTAHATPVAVSGSFRFAALAVGASHACGLTPGGSAYCWGANTDGELGTGSTTRVLVPTAVRTGILFASLAAGNNFTCGIDAAGKAYCWGADTYGALGSGSLGGTVLTPQSVAGGLQFVRLSAGGYHVCGITARNAAYCWGGNSDGQLGNGTTVDRASPQLVSGTHAFSAIGAGYAHTCGTTTHGATYCWGDNTSGQLGDGTFNQRLTPTAALVPSL
jgi:alpha-tubulin suppressor-like RCC1 family protein